MDLSKILETVYEISLKLRVLRAHEKKFEDTADELTPRELLSCELIDRFPYLSCRSLGQLLGIQSTVLNELLAGLSTRGIISHDRSIRDRRKKVLRLTEYGSSLFGKIRKIGSQKYEYAFEGIKNETDLQTLLLAFQKMDERISRRLQTLVDELSDSDESISNAMLGLPEWVCVGREAHRF